MRRARPRRLLLPCACLLFLVAAGCGSGNAKKAQNQPLTFEILPDTAGLSSGEPIVDSLTVERLDGGALRVSGRTELPEGTRLQIAIRPAGGGSSVAMSQVFVNDGSFESPPLTGDFGPLPPATYRFEVLAHFTPEWQPASVLQATNEGRALRGPGVTRSKQGVASFYLEEELKR